MPIARRSIAWGLAAALGLAACAVAAPDPQEADTTRATDQAPTTVDLIGDEVRINQLQSIGTHNSFHVEDEPAEMALLDDLDAQQAAQRQYSHLPLDQQLSTERVRQLELDVFRDDEGGRYARPWIRREAGLGTAPLPGLSRPGLKVLHEQDVDYHSVCPTLVACLRSVKRWSDANPEHAPLAIHVQLKDGPLIFDVPDQVVPERFDAAGMDELDREIRSVFPRKRIITPDDVRGRHATLEDAVLSGAWPTLGRSRGKVMFFMVNGEPYRSVYLQGHPGLKGRVLFTNAPPGNPDAAYEGIDDPVGRGAEIADLVRKGYLVRTRADEPGKEARFADTSRLDAALASGAQWIATDFALPGEAHRRYGTDYVVQLPDGLAVRCNPVNAPADCVDNRLEPVPRAGPDDTGTTETTGVPGPDEQRDDGRDRNGN